MNSSSTAAIRVGVITDVTGPLSLLGVANANIAKMVIDDINSKGGLLGRPLNLHLEDSATTDSVAEAKSRKLVLEEKVDVLLGGIYSSTRQAIKGPVVEGKKLYLYPEQYEGQECHPLIFCTGPVPAQQVESLIPWLMQKTGAKKFYCPSAEYIWPHIMNKKLREAAAAHGGSIVGEEYFPIDHTDYAVPSRKLSPAAPKSSSIRSFPRGSRRSWSNCTIRASPSAAASWSARTLKRTCSDSSQRSR